MKIFKLSLSVIIGLFLFSMAATAIAQDSTPPPDESVVITDDEVNSVAKEVYCPVCESTPLDVCQTQACADWRELIREKLASGESKQDIFDYFSDQYGDRVLATPPREGLNWLLWIMPVAAVVIGGFFFSRFMKNLRVEDEGDDGKGETAVIPPIPADDPSPASQTDAYIAQIEKEIGKK